jgi:hypothetical protein
VRVIEALRAQIEEPHDHLHIQQKQMLYGVGAGGIQASGSPPSVVRCFAYHSARISVSTDTAAARSASDSVDTRTGDREVAVQQ